MNISSIYGRSKKLLGTKGIATRSKDAVKLEAVAEHSAIRPRSSSFVSDQPWEELTALAGEFVTAQALCVHLARDGAASDQ